MSTELATTGGRYTPDQVALIKRTIAKDATDDELRLFVAQCERTGLDPFAKQIHFVKRQGKMVIQTGIDGFRLIADRTGRYVGNDDPTFDDEGSPGKATVTVYKLVNGLRCPFTASARWDQYYPGKQQGFMWDKMPHVMLGKCAEALALRKAFPQDLSGLYTTDEMGQAASDAEVATVEPPKPAQAKQPPAALPAAAPLPPTWTKGQFGALLTAKGWNWEKALRTIDNTQGTTFHGDQFTFEEMPGELLNDFAAWLQQQPDKPSAPTGPPPAATVLGEAAFNVIGEIGRAASQAQLDAVADKLEGNTFTSDELKAIRAAWQKQKQKIQPAAAGTTPRT